MNVMNTVSVSIKGAVTYTESIDVSDEHALDLFRKLSEILTAGETPRRGRRKGAATTPETEAEPKTDSDEAP